MRRKNRQTRSAAGFTLVEIMIVVAIIPIVTFTVAALLIGLPRLYADIENRRVADQQLRTAMQWMGRDIRAADGVSPAAPGESGPGPELRLSMPEETPERLVVWRIEDGFLARTSYADPDGKNLHDRMVIVSKPADFSVSVTYLEGRDRPVSIGATVSAKNAGQGEPFVLELSGEFCPRRR